MIAANRNSTDENPYRSSSVHEYERATAPIHWLLLCLAMLMWLVTAGLWVTPTRQLAAMGLINAAPIDYVLGSFLSLCIGLLSKRWRASSGTLVYWATQLFAWSRAIGPLAFFVFLFFVLFIQGI